jgi:iron complex outermembrane receptor protein
MKMKEGSIILASTVASVLGLAPPLLAADDAPAMGIEEIVVTAQRRAENLQDVPIAITATSGEALERSGVTNAQEIEIVTPGLSFATVGSYAQPRIRGVGTSADAATLENPVAMYVDGVYYAHQAGSVLTLNNIEQVEVIKGPQGTLFGRNATGGLIQITTRQPTQESTGRFSVGYGNYDTFTANAYLAGGITDNLAADIAVYYRDQGEGYGVNRATGQDVQIMENLAARSKWVLTPSDDTTVTFIVDAARDDGAIALAPAPGTTALGGGTLLPAQDVDTPAPYKNRNEQAGASLKIEHSFSPFDLVSISAYRENDDVVYFPNATNNPATMTLVTLDDENFRQASQELQLLSNKDSSFSWTTGVYLFWSEGGWKPVGIYRASPSLPSIASTSPTRRRPHPRRSTDRERSSSHRKQILPSAHATHGTSANGKERWPSMPRFQSRAFRMTESSTTRS